MTHDERIAIYTRDLTALMNEHDAMVIFNLAHDEDTFAQFSHARAGDPLLCEVSNRSEGWNTHSLDAEQVAALRAAMRFHRRITNRIRTRNSWAMSQCSRKKSSEFFVTCFARRTITRSFPAAWCGSKGEAFAIVRFFNNVLGLCIYFRPDSFGKCLAPTFQSRIISKEEQC